MKDLRLGMKGDEVGDWQSFLRGQGYYFGAIDDDFGGLTHDATILFQKAHKLGADGVVGQNTHYQAILLGLNDSSVTSTLFDFPKKPNFQPLVGNALREKMFGKFKFVNAPIKGNLEGIRITDDWESKNIIKVNLPALSKATNGQFTSMRFHKLAEGQLVKFFEELEKQNLHTKILSYAGAFYPRYIRGSRTQLSNHSWGTAFDINVPWNGLNHTPALMGQKGCVRELVPIANEFGFYWGGHFGKNVNGKMIGRMDGMHFEIAKLL